jgi:hypothetical protein
MADIVPIHLIARALVVGWFGQGGVSVIARARL